MKVVRINESQKSRLFEAYSEKFNFNLLKSMGRDIAFHEGTVLAERMSQAQFSYCQQKLGEVISKGSSRCVFTLNDNFVLKLAYGKRFEAGIAQNKTEFETFEKTESPLLTKIVYCDENFTFLVCENVVPCEETDFEKILGMPFYSIYKQRSIKELVQSYNQHGDSTVGYNDYFDNLKDYGETTKDASVYEIMCYIEHNYVLDEPYFSMRCENIIKRIPWFQDLIELIKKTKLSDFCHPNNFGMVNRDGKPQIVILDGGMNLEVWQKHYKNW